MRQDLVFDLADLSYARGIECQTETWKSLGLACATIFLGASIRGFVSEKVDPNDI